MVLRVAYVEAICTAWKEPCSWCLCYMAGNYDHIKTTRSLNWSACDDWKWVFMILVFFFSKPKRVVWNLMLPCVLLHHFSDTDFHPLYVSTAFLLPDIHLSKKQGTSKSNPSFYSNEQNNVLSLLSLTLKYELFKEINFFLENSWVVKNHLKKA